MAHTHAHSAGRTEADLEVVTPRVSWLRREPVLAAALAAATAPLTSLAIELVTADTKPSVAIALAAAIVLINVAGVIARRAVTPTADPKLASRVVLVPETCEREEE
jgi:hypothetical protein